MGISKIKPLTSQYHSVGGSRGRGLLCLAPQLVYFVLPDHCHLSFGKINRFHLMFVTKKESLKIRDVDMILMDQENFVSVGEI